MKTLLIDDEIKAIELLEYYLVEFFSTFEIVGRFTNIKDAHHAIKEDKPDVIFLDVNMPKGTGLDLMQLIIELKIKVILVTAHQQHALEAIKLNVFDYLLKPINLNELKVLNNKLIACNDDNFVDNKIIIKISSTHYVFDVNDIINIKSDGNYTTINSVNQKPLLISKNLKKVEEEHFKSIPFFKTHQSNIININHIISFSNCEVLLTNNECIPVANSKLKLLMKMAKVKMN